jgi:hypothetical protein
METVTIINDDHLPWHPESARVDESAMSERQRSQQLALVAQHLLGCSKTMLWLDVQVFLWARFHLKLAFK